jgi:hypothetical protein
MPNFDGFERIFKSVMTSELSSEEGALKIAGLPDVEKVVLVKNKTKNEIQEFLQRALESLANFFPGEFSFSSSDNNKEGKDLLEVISNTPVELKSGSAMTDGNVGMASIEWALEDKTKSLSRAMSKAVNERKMLLRNQASTSEIQSSKNLEMDILYERISELVEVGPASDKLSHFVRCVSLGLTKGPEIQAAYLDAGNQANPLLLQAVWDSGLEEYEKAFDEDEIIEVVSIDRTEKRVQMVLQGSKSRRIAKIYPHHRNSWTDVDGTKYPASNWASTGSCQVWIR